MDAHNIKVKDDKVIMKKGMKFMFELVALAFQGVKNIIQQKWCYCMHLSAKLWY
jgi:hypothetical protein